MATATSTEKAYASQVGTKRTLPNGDVESIARHPNSKDHVIKVRIRNGKIMEGVVHHDPISVVTMRQKKEAGEVKARADRSASNKAAQLAKKRARSAENNNQNKPNKKK
jgi:hypothetical protein